MRKYFLGWALGFVLGFFLLAFAVSKVTTPYTPISGAVISSSGEVSNRDALRNGINTTIDTVNITIPRWSRLLNNHDSTFQYLRIDTIRNSPNIDTILGTPIYLKGRMVADTLAATRSSATYGVFDTMTTSVYTGTVKADSVWSVKGVKATVGNYSGTVSADSVFSTKGVKASFFNGPLTGTADSAKGSHHLSGGNVLGDSLNIHGTVILKNGNVGIGTVGPEVKLDIHDNSAVITYPLFLSNHYGISTDVDGVGIKFGRSDISQPWGAVVGRQWAGGTYSGGALLFQTETSDALGLETKMVIDLTGNVGIGTTSPGEKLEVTGNIKASGNALVDSVFSTKGIKTSQGATIATYAAIGSGAPAIAFKKITGTTAGTANCDTTVDHNMNVQKIIGWQLIVKEQSTLLVGENAQAAENVFVDYVSSLSFYIRNGPSNTNCLKVPFTILVTYEQ